MSGSDQEPGKIYHRQVYEALDDLWSCIDSEGVKILQPETVMIAREVHELLWHAKQEGSSFDDHAPAGGSGSQ